jgi:hypothetical protein
VEKHLLLWTALALAGCGRCESTPPPSANSAAPAQSAVASSAPVQAAAPKPADPVSAPAGPTKKVVKADGFSLTEYADGQVRIETTDLWNQKLETTYADCEYFTRAIPVLERQLTPERGSKLKQVCTGNKP